MESHVGRSVGYRQVMHYLSTVWLPLQKHQEEQANDELIPQRDAPSKKKSVKLDSQHQQQQHQLELKEQRRLLKKKQQQIQREGHVDDDNDDEVDVGVAAVTIKMPTKQSQFNSFVALIKDVQVRQ